jgi:uncharacterized protein involved in exopolysaccharide biosynthesis
MTEPLARPLPAYQVDEEESLLALASTLLRWRRTIIGLGLFGAMVGLASGLLSTRVYMSAATFIPQGAEGGASGLALAASQFGIRMPSSGGGAWGPPVYVELLRSQALLEPIALDTVVVGEGRRVALMDLLKVEAPTPARRTDLAVRALRRIVKAGEDKKLSAVKLSVATEWPSVSLALAERLVRGVNQFNLETRKSQAAAERQFVEVQAGEAERALREAEDRLQLFLQRNRAIADSPELAFQHDRLQRDVALHQQVYTSLVQSREDAKIREVRDTPVITVLESPRLPVVGEARNSVKKGVLGGFVGGMLGVLIAFLAQGVASARRVPNEEAREFFRLVDEATPRFLRRKGR